MKFEIRLPRSVCFVMGSHAVAVAVAGLGL